VKLKTGTGVKVARQLSLISVNNANEEILDARSDQLTRTIEYVQQNGGVVLRNDGWGCHDSPFKRYDSTSKRREMG